MRLLKIITIALCFLSNGLSAQHPIAFHSAADVKLIKPAIPKYPILAASFKDLKSSVDPWLNKEVDVPFPKDKAGGYTHERHKSNYTLIFNSGLLYNLTGESKYAALVKNILLKYAVLNPTLGKHPESRSSSPGRLFHQALNDANWIMYSALAFDEIYNYLTPAERKQIADGAFKPEVDFITRDLRTWFNLIHNHGVWACAAVGITGIATDNEEYLQMALYGAKPEGRAGFLAQLEDLFSPDGYYTEGPYYVRYALLPFYMFANALENARPKLKIFEYRNRILYKALHTGLNQTNIDGAFFPINDALKDKTFLTNELVTAISIAWEAYGEDPSLLPIAIRQKRVMLTNGGAGIAKAIADGRNIPDYYSYSSALYTDGAKGDAGGIGVLRNGKGRNLSSLIFKYSSHGLSHGHFDKLNINFFNKGSEILTDYGSVRYINVEQKYGGRYLAENEVFAKQTIAHNTLVVDEQSQFKGKGDLSEKHHSELLFSGTEKGIQAISAKEENAYPGVKLHRSLYFIDQQAGIGPLIIDLFRVLSTASHQYDLPFHYNGTLMNTSYKYLPFTKTLSTLGNSNGYQFLWKEAEARPGKGLAQFTFLNGSTFYSISTLTADSDSILFARTGANDPDFNLRREPSYIIRKKGANESFINVIETHGTFNPISEVNESTYSSVTRIRILRNDDEYSVVEVELKSGSILIAQSNSNFDKQTKHKVQLEETVLNWTGPYFINKNSLSKNSSK